MLRKVAVRNIVKKTARKRVKYLNQQLKVSGTNKGHGRTKGGDRGGNKIAGNI